MAEKRPLLSIIVTSYTMERLKDIHDLLNSIKGQTYPNIEVIFIAERSRKLLREVKNHAENIGLNIKALFNEGKWGLSESRNLGVKNAKGEIIAFVDDDVILSDRWAEELVRTFKSDESIVGVTGPALPLWMDKSLSWLPEDLHWLISCTTWFNEKSIVDVRNVWGHNMAFRGDIFSICGLFPEESGYHRGVMAEDLSFSIRIKEKTGKRLVYNPNVKVWHKIYGYRLSLKFIIERSLWIGHSRRMLKRYYFKAKLENPLIIEHLLLKRILSKIFTFSDLHIGAKRLLTFLLILAFVALGYLIPLKFNG